MFFIPKASFKMGTFSDPQHTHPGIFILESTPRAHKSVPEQKALVGPWSGSPGWALVGLPGLGPGQAPRGRPVSGSPCRAPRVGPLSGSPCRALVGLPVSGPCRALRVGPSRAPRGLVSCKVVNLITSTTGVYSSWRNISHLLVYSTV